MFKGEVFPMQPSAGLDGGSPEPVQTPESWRERQPVPIFVVEPTIIRSDQVLTGETKIHTDEDANKLAERLDPVREQIMVGIDNGFSASFGPKNDAPPFAAWAPGWPIHELYKERFAVFNPVYFGPMTETMLKAFETADLDASRELLRTSLPEVWPLSLTVAKEMDIAPIDPNFVNVVFIQDNDHRIDKLSADHRVALSRLLMAKFGSWKVDIATYSLDDEGKASLNNVTMASLEGGHPSFGPKDLDELGWRHKVFASTNKIDIQKVPAADTEPIPFSAWETSPTVEGIRASGRELGKRGLLSDSVTMSSLVSDRRLARMIEGLARFSQQGEGALFAWDPKMDKLIVSSTGQMGAMKADLKLNEVVAIVDIDGDSIGMVPVEEMGEPLKPSVEGPEFGYPMWSLLEKHPIWLNESDGGYILAENGEGAYKVPPIRAGGHLHRGVIPQNNSRVIHMGTSAYEWPPVGCGVDASDEYSHHVFNKAVEMWEASGRQVEFITFKVHGHSTNYLQFYAAGKVNAANHAEPLIEVLDNGEMQLTPEVPQVNERIIPVKSAA